MTAVARLNRRITRLAATRHLPHRAARMRLTLLYGGLFLLSGAALMAIAYALLVNAGFVFTLGPTPAASSQPRLRGDRWPSGRPIPGAKTHPSAQTMADFRSVARCMRLHGVAAFPDPTTSVPRAGSFYGVISDHGGAIFAVPATIDTQSAAYTQAAGTCGLIDAYQQKLYAENTQRRAGVREQLLVQSAI